MTFLPLLVLQGYGLVAGLVLTAAAALCVVLSGIRYGIAKEKADALRPGEKEILEKL